MAGYLLLLKEEYIWIYCVQVQKNFEHLTDYKYHFVIGRKGEAIEFDLTFNETDFHHLAGLHKLKDNDFIRTSSRKKIFERILNEVITEKTIQKSVFYSEIKDRLYSLNKLEELLDDNVTIFRFYKNNKFATKINADYILKCGNETNTVFVFIIKNAQNMHCVSQFPMENIDYSKHQTKFTILLKEKIYVPTQDVVLFYKNPAYK